MKSFGPMLVSTIVFAAACSRTIVAVDRVRCADAAAVGADACVSPGLVNDLVGYWRLDDPVGSTNARDWSGSGNDGMLVDLDPGTVWGTGGPEGGYLAPGGKGHIEVKPSSSIDSISTGFTAAAWIYIDGAISIFATAISRQLGSTINQLYHLDVSADLLGGVFLKTTSSGTQVFLQSTNTISQQTWVHLASTYDGARVRLYVDGVQVADGPQEGPFLAEANPVVLGGNGNGAAHDISEAIPGRLAGVMLYRRALSADEIALVYAGALTLAGQRTDGGDH